MAPTDSDPTTGELDRANGLDRARVAYVDAKSVGTEDGPGRYAGNADSILGEFTAWVAREQGVTRLADLGTADVRAYVRRLAGRQRNGDYAVSTTHTYFRTVRAWLGWCSRNGWLDTNPAADDAATEDLPTASSTESDARQVWTDEARHELLMWVRRRKESAYDRPLLPVDRRLRRTRDHALVSLLARTGVRGAEAFRDVENSQRDGLT